MFVGGPFSSLGRGRLPGLSAWASYHVTMLQRAPKSLSPCAGGPSKDSGKGLCRGLISSVSFLSMGKSILRLPSSAPMKGEWRDHQVQHQQGMGEMEAREEGLENPQRSHACLVTAKRELLETCVEAEPQQAD